MKKTLLSVILIASVTLAATAQNVNIPDAQFKAYLVGQAEINTNGDTEIQVSEAQAFNGSIYCNDLSITDLTGIEAFTVLTELNCSDNQLTSLDVSANTALTDLYCSQNQLTSLDVSANMALTVLGCPDNQLTSLDVSTNTALWELYCYNNQLTSLDVSANTALELLHCSNNQLTWLDVSANTTLRELFCYDNQLTWLDVSANMALRGLRCHVNQLTSLDVSANTALEVLHCDYNQLTSLDVSADTALELLHCDYNQLTSLDVSANTTLRELYCYYNQLTSLDVRNGNNTSLYVFNATGNPGLTCIGVDNAAYSTASWPNIDGTASFSEDCSLGIDDISTGNHFSVYPNLVKDMINFSVQTNVQLFSATGQLLSEKKNVTTLDLSGQPAGIYLLTHTDNNGQVIQRNRIVKE